MNNFIKTEELKELENKIDYDVEFPGDSLFPNKHFNSVQFAWYSVAGKDRLPLYAPVKALDTVTPLGTRPDAKRMTAEAFHVGLKMNVTETLAKLKTQGIIGDEAKRFIFDDIKRVYLANRTSMEAKKMELVANGNVTIVENGVNMRVNYDFDNANLFVLVLDKSTDLFELKKKIDMQAESKGKKINALLISPSLFRSVFMENEKLIAMLKETKRDYYPSVDLWKNYVRQWFDVAIEFLDGQYNYLNEKGEEVTTNYYPKDTMTFLSLDPTIQTLGVGAWCPTSEKLIGLNGVDIDNVRITTWMTEDPAGEFVKGTSSQVPILKDADDLFIVKQLA